MAKRLKFDDHACRINYLYQAAETVAEIGHLELAGYYGHVSSVVSQKTSAKQDFSMKRSLCKQCHVVLVPGVSCSYRLKRKRKGRGEPTLILKCKACGEPKRLPANKNYQLATENHPVIERGASNANEATKVPEESKN